MHASIEIYDVHSSVDIFPLDKSMSCAESEQKTLAYISLGTKLRIMKSRYCCNESSY